MPRGFFLGVFSLVCAGILLALLNIIQTLSFVILPFSRPVFRRVNTFCAGTFWEASYRFGRFFYGTKITVVGDAIPLEENALVVVNHQMMPDVWGVWEIARRANMLRNLKWFAKSALKWIPGIGWGLWCVDGIFLQRNWEEDKAKVIRYLGKYKREKIPMWLVTFPEGTRRTPKKLEASQAFARQRGLPVLSNVLLPRSKGFVVSVEGLRDHCDAVYAFCIQYQKGVTSLWHWVQGLGGDMTITVRRFPISSVPTGEKEISRFLLARFEEMDATLST